MLSEYVLEKNPGSKWKGYPLSRTAAGSHARQGVKSSFHSSLASDLVFCFRIFLAATDLEHQVPGLLCKGAFRGSRDPPCPSRENYPSMLRQASLLCTRTPGPTVSHNQSSPSTDRYDFKTPLASTKPQSILMLPKELRYAIRSLGGSSTLPVLMVLTQG